MKKRYIIQARCLDRKGRVLSTAVNSYTKTHPVQAHFASLAGDPQRKYLHAEILALLRSADHKVHTIEITNLSGGPIPYPCPVCTLAIKSWGVKHISLPLTQSPFH